VNRTELEKKFFKARAWTENTGRSLLIFALGIAFLQLSRDPSTAYRPLIIMFQSFSCRYSIFGNFFICVALLRMAAAEADNPYRAALYSGFFLHAAHGILSGSDRLGLFGTPALLEAAVSWYPGLLILHLIAKISRKQQKWAAGPLMLLPLAACFSLLVLNTTALFFLLSSVPIVRLLLRWSMIATGAAVGRLLFITAIIQILLLLYLRYKKERIFPNFTKLEASVYLDKEGRI